MPAAHAPGQRWRPNASTAGGRRSTTRIEYALERITSRDRRRGAALARTAEIAEPMSAHGQLTACSPRRRFWNPIMRARRSRPRPPLGAAATLTRNSRHRRHRSSGALRPARPRRRTRAYPSAARGRQRNRSPPPCRTSRPPTDRHNQHTGRLAPAALPRKRRRWPPRGSACPRPSADQSRPCRPARACRQRSACSPRHVASGGGSFGAPAAPAPNNTPATDAAARTRACALTAI